MKKTEECLKISVQPEGNNSVQKENIKITGTEKGIALWLMGNTEYNCGIEDSDNLIHLDIDISELQGENGIVMANCWFDGEIKIRCEKETLYEIVDVLLKYKNENEKLISKDRDAQVEYLDDAYIKFNNERIYINKIKSTPMKIMNQICLDEVHIIILGPYGNFVYSDAGFEIPGIRLFKDLADKVPDAEFEAKIKGTANYEDFISYGTLKEGKLLINAGVVANEDEYIDELSSDEKERIIAVLVDNEYVSKDEIEEYADWELVHMYRDWTYDVNGKTADEPCLVDGVYEIYDPITKIVQVKICSEPTSEEFSIFMSDSESLKDVCKDFILYFSDGKNDKKYYDLFVFDEEDGLIKAYITSENSAPTMLNGDNSIENNFESFFAFIVHCIENKKDITFRARHIFKMEGRFEDELYEMEYKFDGKKLNKSYVHNYYVPDDYISDVIYENTFDVKDGVVDLGKIKRPQNRCKFVNVI